MRKITISHNGIVVHAVPKHSPSHTMCGYLATVSLWPTAIRDTDRPVDCQNCLDSAADLAQGVAPQPRERAG
jgi:hypothetical protein